MRKYINLKTTMFLSLEAAKETAFFCKCIYSVAKGFIYQPLYVKNVSYPFTKLMSTCNVDDPSVMF